MRNLERARTSDESSLIQLGMSGVHHLDANLVAVHCLHHHDTGAGSDLNVAISAKRDSGTENLLTLEHVAFHFLSFVE